MAVHTFAKSQPAPLPRPSSPGGRSWARNPQRRPALGPMARFLRELVADLENDQTVQDEVTESGKQVSKKRKSKKDLPDAKMPNTDQLEFF